MINFGTRYSEGRAIITSSKGDWRWPQAIRSRMPYHHGRRYADWILIGGQNALDTNGSVLHVDSPQKQAVVAMDHVYDVLRDLGGAPARLVKLTVFYVAGVTDEEPSIMKAIRSSVGDGEPPAISMIPLPRLAIPGLAVTIDAFGVVPRANKQLKHITPAPSRSRWAPDAVFSEAVRYGDIVFASGQMSVDASGATQDVDDIVSQARGTIANVGKVLAALNCDLDDVVKLNTWYAGNGTDDDWRRAAEVRGNAFRFPGPGATGVPVPLPFPRGVLLRQECMAIRSSSTGRVPRALSWPLGHWDWSIPVSFQQGLKIGSLVVLGGQISTDIACKAVDPGNMRAQTANVMTAIRNILAGFELGIDSIAKLTCYYKTGGDPRDLKDMLDVCATYFTEEPAPPITLVPLENLGFEDVTLEIEGLAFAS